MKAYGYYPTSSFEKLRRLQSLAQKDPRSALKKACREFEGLLLHQILKGLDRTVMRSGFFPEGLEIKIYRDLFYQEISRELAGRGLGLSDLLYRELSRYLPEEKFMPKSKNAEKGGRDG
ncbi:rod-binding protein [Thermosulfurimonas dismutans]|uniref:Flagellar protein FlgJ N-terminal domain-containing protein n=1 Tax=Thermosulfurimonas dismutans TaxID=999894 RepID=A0A179D318_9BACT|nr:rod-binding protein [Thermosulfurimonas dismutans]OAQ20474.1 hypothetical protein TDIS_1383 [Thermosulfurimonas dismutans]